MPFEPVQFYQLASALYREKADSEAARRTVVSRAYYGVFLASREQAGITTKGKDVHGDVIRHFQTLRRTGVANRLGELRILRNAADYELAAAMTSLQAGNALQKAESILQELKVLPPRSTPPKSG
jgi:uncharacterized protein (UPF0332 family)